MDDGEVDFSEQEMLGSSSNLPCEENTSPSIESFLDEILKSTHTCTHTHTCNPPGPDKTHTHTCFHTHTQLFASPEEGSSHKPGEDQQVEKETAAGKKTKKRPLGNREAVRKYREKKKAHTAYLEEQVAQLKVLNQQLLKRLQGQAALEAEVARLRGLLSEFRGRIDSELGLYPYKRPCSVLGSGNIAPDCSTQINGGFYLNTVSVPCDADVPCFHSESDGHPACEYGSESCQVLAQLDSEGL